MGMTGYAWQWIEARDDLAPLATVRQAFSNVCQHTFVSLAKNEHYDNLWGNREIGLRPSIPRIDMNESCAIFLRS